MPTDKEVRSARIPAAYALKSVLAERFSNLYGAIFTPKVNPIDAVSFKRGDGGIWLCVAKRLNTDSGEREVAFARGSDLAEALAEMNRAVAAGIWKTDKPWP